MDPRTHLTGTARDAGTSFVPVRKSYRWSGAVTAQLVWAPGNGARIVVTDYLVSIGTAGKVTVFAESNALDTLCLEIDGTDKGGAAMAHLRSPIVTTGGQRILITTTGGGGTVTLYGYEESDI